MYFQFLADGVRYQRQRIAQRINSELPREVVLGMTREHHRALEMALQEEVKSSILGHFDNVGCHLPESVFGYPFLRSFRGDTDYADMWLDYILRSENSTSNRGSDPLE